MTSSVSAVGCMPLLDCGVFRRRAPPEEGVSIPLPITTWYEAAEFPASVKCFDSGPSLGQANFGGGPERRARDLDPDGSFVFPEVQQTLRRFQIEAVAGSD